MAKGARQQKSRSSTREKPRKAPAAAHGAIATLILRALAAAPGDEPARPQISDPLGLISGPRLQKILGVS
jgi:hypothetical protein